MKSRITFWIIKEYDGKEAERINITKYMYMNIKNETRKRELKLKKNFWERFNL